MKFKLRDRAFYEALEEKILAPYATKSKGANTTRIYKEEMHPYRTAIQRDRDRIIHSKAFRRLKHKQQVFLISDGDHYRTRITHTLEVSQLSRTLAKALGLNEELAETIALGHDLGHTPFGHAGEVVLNSILSGKDDLDGLLTPTNFGGFKHNYQSLRVVDKIEKKYQFEGLNLTSYVREGILKHTRLLRNLYQYPEFIKEGLYFELDNSTTLEGQVVAICDEVAQRTHDLEDGIRAELVGLDQVRKVQIIKIVEERSNINHLFEIDQFDYLNRMIHGLINLLMDDIIQTTLENINNFYVNHKRYHYFDCEIVTFSQFMNPLQLELDDFISREIIFKGSKYEKSSDNLNIIRNVFKHLLKLPSSLPKNIIQKSPFDEQELLTTEDLTFFLKDGRYVRMIADYIAGMTDRYVITELEKYRCIEEEHRKYMKLHV